MIVLSGADLVLPDRIVPSGTLSIEDGLIVAIDGAPMPSGPGDAGILHGHTIVPGFVDVHVHGVCGSDVLDEGEPIARIAANLPRYGVTAFCPTTVACGPPALRRVLAQVKQCRQTPPGASARVLPAHLESNFINPEYRGAQPLECLRLPHHREQGPSTGRSPAWFSAGDIIQVIEECVPDVAIVTLAPELPGALDLIEWLVARGVHVSLGHSAATFEEAIAAFDRGARQVTHLFNRMLPLGHCQPGLAGAALQNDDIVVELICDGVHVHPAVVRMAAAAKSRARVMAISDGTAVGGLEAGAEARLGGRRITAAATHACLDDGTMAGSVLTMDVVFQRLTSEMGLSLVDAAAMCSTTPARTLGLVGHGVLAEGAAADLAVVDRSGRVVQTYVGGRLVHARNGISGRAGNSTDTGSV
jgi:N-acetylglucosamine-6-phosphate deacetylase